MKIILTESQLSKVTFVEMAKCRNGKMSKNYNYSLFYYFLL